MLKQDSTFGLSLDIKLDGFSRNAALFCRGDNIKLSFKVYPVL